MDRRIPVALIFAVMVQFGVFIAAWTQMQSDISSTKTSVYSLKTTLDTRDIKTTQNLEKLIGLERDIKYLVDGLRRMEETVNGILKYELDKSRQESKRKG